MCLYVVLTFLSLFVCLCLLWEVHAYATGFPSAACNHLAQPPDPPDSHLIIFTTMTTTTVNSTTTHIHDMSPNAQQVISNFYKTFFNNSANIFDRRYCWGEQTTCEGGAGVGTVSKMSRYHKKVRQSDAVQMWSRRGCQKYFFLCVVCKFWFDRCYTMMLFAAGVANKLLPPFVTDEGLQSWRLSWSQVRHNNEKVERTLSPLWCGFRHKFNHKVHPLAQQITALNIWC